MVYEWLLKQNKPYWQFSLAQLNIKFAMIFRAIFLHHLDLSSLSLESLSLDSKYSEEKICLSLLVDYDLAIYFKKILSSEFFDFN